MMPSISSTEQSQEPVRRLFDLTNALCQTMTGERVADVIVEEAIRASGSSGALLALYDPELARLTQVSQRGLADDVALFPNACSSGRLNPAEDTVSRGKSLFFESRQEVIDGYPHLKFPPQDFEATALLLLNTEQQILGVLELRWQEVRRFSAQDMTLLQTIANMCSLALARVHFFDTTQEEAAERQRVAEALHRLNSELEARVAGRTAQLQAAVEELEAFSYSISHDLRAPLRAIDGFSRILLEEFAPSLPETVQRYLGRVRINAQNMGKLIDDLLAFSRLNRHAINRQPIAFSTLIQQALDTLNPDMQDREIRFEIDTLPDCAADETLLRQVFMNLLSNALKFTRGCTPAIIEIGFQQEHGETTYFVRDNGIGFDMQYYSKLFGVFQRLHRSEDFEGTGVGLALVQRIINRHGGRLWAEGKLHTGATFYFTLDAGETDA